MQKDPREFVGPREDLPDIPGRRNRWQRKVGFVRDGVLFVLIEEFGEGYLDPNTPPLFRLTYNDWV